MTSNSRHGRQFQLSATPRSALASYSAASYLGDDSEARGQFAQGFAAGRGRAGGWNWIEGLPLRDWSSRQVANLALVLSREARAWRLVEAHGRETEKLYWEAANLLGVRGQDDIAHAVRMLLRFHRPFSAADLLAMALHTNAPVATDLILETLESGIQPSDSLIEKPWNTTGHSYQELFRYLQSGKGEVDDARLAQLEWAYLSVLDGHGANPSTLHRPLGLYRSTEALDTDSHQQHHLTRRWNLTTNVRFRRQYRLKSVR